MQAETRQAVREYLESARELVRQIDAAGDRAEVALKLQADC